ncbi:aminotransferase class I/II-fold pyridoxal phosphate-dependent enzyme [Clostridium swellfunianum]|uniref:pyridoxal phosphate-dependent aminotransferase n=1 Tax=Clostridium swellfunianum TaxID=1367462 RepID=UPI00202E4D6A|nr:aminotransferase class I/II-fold pyridoxal phosphate-dependent enzyme [Clostridium swellfunianum]MCM0650629.1 aminotransferase class I/II-fold pyridoxal phosphate-dependent enzyme [Clostridium swellfunianum]
MKDMFSLNVQSIEISGIRKFFNKVAEVPEALSLTLGQPDFNVPEKIKASMIKAIDENKTGYTSNAGIIELRQQIASYLKGFDINYEAEEICTTIGGSEALLSVFMSIINQGDKVLIPSPAYPAYESCVKLVGGEVVNYQLNEDFTINFEEVKAVIQRERPKVLVVSYPSNPTGAFLSKEDRDKLYEFLKYEEIIVVSDEIYSALCYEINYYSICQFKDIKHKVILVSGFSKMFSMTGLRLGYVCAPSNFMHQIMKVHQYNVSCAPSIVQWGAYEGLKSCLGDVEEMKEEFKKRRDYLYDRLTAMGMDVVLPKGAFYMFPSIKKYGLTSEEFCERLLREGYVAVVPGSAFGVGGEGYIRISYSYSMESLEEGMNRLEKWLKESF